VPVAAVGHDAAVTKRPASILERPVYGVSEAAGLLGLRADRARAWLDGYERRGSQYGPVIRVEPTGEDVVTWGEFVELGYLREYRRKGVLLQRLRPVIDELRAGEWVGEISDGYPNVGGARAGGCGVREAATLSGGVVLGAGQVLRSLRVIGASAIDPSRSACGEHRVRGFVLTGRKSQSTANSFAVLERHWTRIETSVPTRPRILTMPCRRGGNP
jgi:hypothetical protein